MQRRKSAIRSPVSLDANGPKLTFEDDAANGGSEPKVTDAAARTNVQSGENLKKGFGISALS